MPAIKEMITIEELQQRFERFGYGEDMTLFQAQQVSRIERDHLNYLYKLFCKETNQPERKMTTKSGFYRAHQAVAISRQQLIDLIEWYNKKYWGSE